MDIENNENLLDINQLSIDEQMQNADEAFAQTVTGALEEEVPGESNNRLVSNLVRDIRAKFEEADRQREGDEQRWLNAYKNYRGHHSKHIKFTENEKSKVFVKVTKTKVIAAYGQLVDVMFANNQFPIAIQSTKVPEGTADFVHVKGQEVTPEPEVTQPEGLGYPGDGLELPPGAKFSDITQGLRKELKGGDYEEGPSLDGSPTLRPAKEAARRMEKLIHDQIEESNGAGELRSALFECAMLGTGIIKGPFNYNKTLHRWEKDEAGARTHKEEQVKVPRIEFCSIWNAYPDPNATTLDEAEWFIQRHKMSKSQLRGLRNRPFFSKKAINEALDEYPNYNMKDFETEITGENSNVQPMGGDRYEVLEYWGLMDKDFCEEAGLQLGDQYDNLEEVQVNAWICGGKLLRVVINPFTPARIPYLAFPYERNPYSFFGIGVAENMDDSQKIMNGHARMAIDNLALAGNLVFDVDESALVPGQTMEVHPGKIFKRAAGMPGQAIYGVKFPNTAPENLQMFDKFRQIADESTGIPSYAHGQTGVMSTTRTAAGMSMLMGAASLNIKTVVKNIDDFLLKPLGEALFQWNMNFYEGDLEIVGDLEVKAGGTASLMQKEVRSQRLTNFMQVIQNPAIAPFVKMPSLIKAFCESLDLDPEEFLNDEDEAKAFAAIIGAAGGIGALGAQGGMPVGAGGQGEMGVGGVPMPQEQGFTGNPEGMEAMLGAAQPTQATG